MEGDAALRLEQAAVKDLLTVKEQINTPFYSFSLIQLPIMVPSMPKNKKVGVLTANGPLLQKVSAIENCGLSAEDKANRIVIEGCENDKAFAEAMACDGAIYNPVAIEKDILAATKRLLKKDKETGNIRSPHGRLRSDRSDGCGWSGQCRTELRRQPVPGYTLAGSYPGA